MLRVAALRHPGAFGERTMQEMQNEAGDAANRLGLQLQFIAVHGPDELDGAFSEMVRMRVEALFLLPSQMLFSERRRIIRLAEMHRLPAMYNGKEFAELGGLIAYGASTSDLMSRTAAQVDRILKGTKPSDVPVEQPTKFDLVINLKTAKALGLELPPMLVARADAVIE
jgi:putative ABC transport system substrate-binding protein